MKMQPPTERFSSRVEDYRRYRPGYPLEVMALLRHECGLTPELLVADIASGTGIFTRQLLENGNRVFGIEPNPEMRRAGEQYLAAFAGFRSLPGTAEQTGLAEASVDLITCAQAAHWFERERARREFARILRPGGWLVLIWNERQTDVTPFLADYEKLLARYGRDYQEVRHEHTTAAVGEFFSPVGFGARAFPLRQSFDYAGVEGRLRSSSYIPSPEEASYGEMLAELRRIFERHQQRGRVDFEYLTRVFYGRPQ